MLLSLFCQLWREDFRSKEEELACHGDDKVSHVEENFNRLSDGTGQLQSAEKHPIATSGSATEQR